ncbi:DUF7146 domain-containing protein [Alkalimarinus alittae]|uniref:Toprim domain-containing protein n=1 Tax=Alkalimarinus alittae TaxID=2961619 RepID=A0ABY6N572_9ALTE|nr:toprim domain-containing protein [Alkalimarinus alittae]UZE97268.1 toprim domain-containing protein [Alkalimarinus alittae]
MRKRNSTQLKEKMSGYWLNAFAVLAPGLRHAVKKLGQNVPCPIDGGTDGFRLFNDANETGGGVKQSERIIPEGIDMLMWVNNWSFTQAFDELEGWMNGAPIQSQPVIHIPKVKVVDEANLRKWLNRIWGESLSLEHQMSYPARAYFGYRRISQAALTASDIRFHPNLNYKDTNGNSLGTFGAVLCLVRNNEGNPVSIHRTFLTKSGVKVNLGEKNKARKVTPPVLKDSKGRQLRLFEPKNGYLGVCEGLETALAVHQAKQLPIWPNLSNTNLHSFIAPPGIHTVINFVDKDRSKAGKKPAGENSALILEANLKAQGIRVINLLPPIPILDTDKKGVDWADQLIRDPRGFDLIDQAVDFVQLKQA